MTYLHAGDWDVNANGIKGTLSIDEVDELGRVSGTLLEQPITGWWSERARRLSFLRDRDDAARQQGYEGYAWDERDRNGSPRTYYLAGSFETFGGAGGARDRP